MTPYLVVSPDQYCEGYVVLAANLNPAPDTPVGTLIRMPYRLIKRLEDGNYLVEDYRVTVQSLIVKGAP